jgi:hypothetical protein
MFLKRLERLRDFGDVWLTLGLCWYARNSGSLGRRVGGIGGVGWQLTHQRAVL